MAVQTKFRTYVAHSICNLKYSVNKKVHTAFHNGSNYGYHFIIKELAKEFKKTIYLGETNEKYITFTVSIEKEVTITYREREEIAKNISYILQFIDSARLMAISLSNLVNNFSEKIYRIKRKFRHCGKRCEI